MRERGKEIGWNTDLQAPTYAPRDPDIGHLLFLRKLSEKGKLEHIPLSVPRGENLFRCDNETIRHYAMIQADALKPSIGTRKADALIAHIAKYGDY